MRLGHTLIVLSYAAQIPMSRLIRLEVAIPARTASVRHHLFDMWKEKSNHLGLIRASLVHPYFYWEPFSRSFVPSFRSHGFRINFLSGNLAP